MNNSMNEFINWAEENGWTVTKKPDIQLNLDSSFIARYNKIPEEYVSFIRMVKQCITPNEKTWFLCEAEYNNNSSELAFKWNEFELLSLEGAMDDVRWKSEITEWWDNYLPIVMSVDGGYSFYAIDLTDETGAIVHGCEPEFEEVERVANHLEEFFQLIMSNSIVL